MDSRGEQITYRRSRSYFAGGTFWFWFALTVGALVVRLMGLNAPPLSPAETRIALPSLDAVRGAGWPDAIESPFLFMGNVLLFLLLGPSDATARLLPALLGTCLVALPWLWRRRMGETGALVATGLLALSPIALFAARHLDATVVGVLGGALVITVLSIAPRHAALWLAAGLALGLTGGAAFYDTLLPGLAAWAFARRFYADERALLERAWLLRGVLIGVGGAVLISVGFGVRWSGWAGPAAGFTSWLQGWWTGEAASLNLGHLLLYEPLTLLLAMVGLYLGTQRPDRFSFHMGVWAVLGGLLTVLRADAGPVSLLSMLLPLVLLAGRALVFLCRSLKSTWHVYLHAGVVVLFWSFAGLVLIRQTTYLQSGMEFFLVMLVVLIQGLLVAGFATLVDAKTVWRSFLIGTSVLLLALQISFAWRANFNEATAPHEPLVNSLASRDLYNLHETMETLRIADSVSPEHFDVVLVAAEDPVTTATLRWALRAWPALRVNETWPSTSFETSDVVITPVGLTPASDVTGLFQGIDFTVAVRAADLVPSCTQLLPPVCPGAINWYIYRKSPAPVEKIRIVLWTPKASVQP